VAYHGDAFDSNDKLNPQSKNPFEDQRSFKGHVLYVIFIGLFIAIAIAVVIQRQFQEKFVVHLHMKFVDWYNKRNVIANPRHPPLEIV